MQSVFSSILGFVVAASVSVAAAQAPDLRLVDLTGEFDRFATSTGQLPDEERVAAFEQQIGALADGFYARSRKPERYDSRVIKSLHDYPQAREGILAVSRQFEALFGPARASFERAIGPVSSPQPVYLLHSVGEMDGGTRKLDGKSTLIFGADVIARIHAGNDMTPFFHHELFHVYHRQRFGDCEPIWCSLWAEGLATYVASALNPGAGDAALLLDVPAPIRPPVDADRAAAFCAVIPLLESEDEQDYAALFYGNAHLPGFPARMGYYIGYLVAADIARSRDLRALAELKPAEVRPLIRASLDSMATCPEAEESDERG